jgi:hypothetical protein
MAESMGFELIGEGMPFPQAYTHEKCNMPALAEMIMK